MSVQSEPVEPVPRRLDSGPVAVLTAVVALVATVALLWGVGTVTEDDPTPSFAGDGAVVANGGNGATAEPAAATTPTTINKLETPVGHHGEYEVHYDILPAETRQQLDVVRSIIERYPTGADAERDGWRRATTNLKGIAAHYLRSGVAGFLGTDAAFDVNEPEILLFDGETPDAPIVGVSYLASGADPEGFAGKWDVWHRHDAVCFAGGLVIGELGGHEDSQINMTEQQCAEAGGMQFPIAHLTMLHVWMKPGFESSAGVFSHDHPELR
jgi:hypothetical protein